MVMPHKGLNGEVQTLDARIFHVQHGIHTPTQGPASRCSLFTISSPVSHSRLICQTPELLPIYPTVSPFWELHEETKPEGNKGNLQLAMSLESYSCLQECLNFTPYVKPGKLLEVKI